MSGSFPSVGSTFDGRYRLMSVVSPAPGGQVVTARDELRNAEVTLRLVATEYAYGFRSFADAALRLAHVEGVVPDQVPKDGPPPYLVMGALRGESIRDLLRGGPIPWARAVAIAEACAQTLARAHAQGCVHGALRPGCVYIERAGGVLPPVQIFDFRAAELVMPDLSTERTMTFTLGLDPEYASPEQIRGDRPGAASDVYSLGVLLFEMLTGRPPFIGPRQAVSHGHVKLPPPRIADVAPMAHVPEHVEALLARALAKKRTDRFASTQELATALQEARTAEPSLDEMPTQLRIPVERRPEPGPRLDPLPNDTHFGPRTLTERRLPVEAAKRLCDPELGRITAPGITAEVPRRPAELDGVTALVPRATPDPQTALVPRSAAAAPQTAVVPRMPTSTPQSEAPQTAIIPRAKTSAPQTAVLPRQVGAVREPTTLVIHTDQLRDARRAAPPPAGVAGVEAMPPRPLWERHLVAGMVVLVGLFAVLLVVIAVLVL